MAFCVRAGVSCITCMSFLSAVALMPRALVPGGRDAVHPHSHGSLATAPTPRRLTGIVQQLSERRAWPPARAAQGCEVVAGQLPRSALQRDPFRQRRLAHAPAAQDRDQALYLPRSMWQCLSRGLRSWSLRAGSRAQQACVMPALAMVSLPCIHSCGWSGESVAAHRRCNLEQQQGLSLRRTCCATGIGCSISKKNVAFPYAGVSTTMRLAAANTKTKACSSLHSGGSVTAHLHFVCPLIKV